MPLRAARHINFYLKMLDMPIIDYYHLHYFLIMLAWSYQRNAFGAEAFRRYSHDIEEQQLMLLGFFIDMVFPSA